MAVMSALTGCDNGTGLSREQAAAVDKAHVDARNRCRDKWYGKPRAPVRGTNYVLDATKLPWDMGGELWHEDEDCGVAKIDAVFYWTGEEILPQRVGMYPQQEYNVKPIDVREAWTQIQVLGYLGMESSIRQRLEQHPEGFQIIPRPQRPKTWPTELVVKLKHYPDLEVWLPKEWTPTMERTTHYLSFQFPNWPNDDGVTRGFNCNLGRAVYPATREEIENLDLRQKVRSSCQMEFDNFGFNSGSAKVNWGTPKLTEITPALRALQKYFNDSITKE